ncbi:MAG TPA: hypothetical protein PK624_14200 [Spirochaetota bacterium]|nr:hypothetical protein [Spirochaetota bacterium]HOR45942.1 hypothetical protein [Spirochaetota bacterium]HOU85823.1 hypothetical protein [Spirochaetota bacterium]HPK57609.1 hypothetical protein [Spirochaetota bacterium]HQE60020.1 hypothetical protein [Spirochaetota bacterium]
MNKILLYMTVFFSSVCIYPDDLVLVYNMTETLNLSETVLLAHPLDGNEKEKKMKTSGGAEFGYKYMIWIVDEVVTGSGNIKPGTAVHVSEPYQFMEVERRESYLKSGLDEGLVEYRYSSESSVKSISIKQKYILMLNGNDPGNLVLTCLGSIEPAGKLDEVKKILLVIHSKLNYAQ